MIHGKREKREKCDGPVSGMLIYDLKSNERGGYTTSDGGDMASLLTLDRKAIKCLLPMRMLLQAQAYGSQMRSIRIWS